VNILIVDDETLVRKTLQSQIESDSKGHKIFSAASLEAALEILEAENVDLVLTDLSLDDQPERAGLKLLREISKNWPGTVAVAMTGHDEDALVEQCLKAGASDYILKPIDATTLRQTVRKAPVLHRLLSKGQNFKNQAGRDALQPFELRSKSPAFNAVLEKARKMRGTPHSILIRGESGAGKEVLARYLWSFENDDARPFVPVNCGAITASLAESELFGHKRGSFSGATEHRTGKFETANGGDLFLDELATLSMEIQIKLLRVLSTGEISPVGQDTVKKVTCRVITATNEDLEAMIQAKTFREDLFFRVKQFSLTIPPLRERREDIMDLARQFLDTSGYADKRLGKDAEKLLLTYAWPGNVRELKSAVEVAAVFADGSEITPQDIRPQLQQTEGPGLAKAIPQGNSNEVAIDESVLEGNFKHLVSEFEQKLIATALQKCGSENSAAKFLGIPRSTLGDIRRRLTKTSK
jgi:DNA-binding NtrC family response regulator